MVKKRNNGIKIKSFKSGKLKITNIKRIKSVYYKKKDQPPFYSKKKYIYQYKINFPKKGVHIEGWEGWLPANNKKGLKKIF